MERCRLFELTCLAAGGPTCQHSKAEIDSRVGFDVDVVDVC